MKLKLIQHICMAGNIVNEDSVSYGLDFGLVLDGSTGLRKGIIHGAESDAKWFVENFKNCIEENIKRDQGLAEIVKQCIGGMKTKFANLELGEIDKINEPSASIAVVRKLGNKLEIFSLGDCTILIETLDYKLHRVYDDTVSRLDGAVETKMAQLSKERRIPVLQTRSLVEEELIKNRNKKNTEGGYWILGFNAEAVEHGIYKSFDVSNIKRICLFSDGFADYYESLNLARDYMDFYKQLTESGAKDIYLKLRKAQDEDYLCNLYPRLKQKDDASILIFQIEKE